MALLVKIPNKKDEKYVAELLKRLGFAAEFIDADTLEDIALGAIIKKNTKKGLLSLEQARILFEKLN
jgi:hypothetical protein